VGNGLNEDTEGGTAMNHENDHDAQERLKVLNLEIGEAEKRRDARWLRSVLADELYFKRASGDVNDRATYLADLLKPENSFESLKSESVDVTVYETTAVVSLRVRAKGKRGEKSFDGVFRNTRLFYKEPEGWKCVVWYNVPIESR
jgi:hypothetical protein